MTSFLIRDPLSEPAADGEKANFFPITYELAVGNALVLELDCDDGTNSTNFTFTADIELL